MGKNNELAVIQGNNELAQLYNENATLGADNLTGKIPLLKVHTVGKSKNLLVSGAKPKDGAFYYAPTQAEYSELDVHILTISKGFYADGMNGGDKKFNQLVGGVFKDGDEYRPFIMYFSGKKLNNLWNFANGITKYTHAKPIAFPMFSMTVTLTTESVETPFGSSWVVNFDLNMNEDFPKLVTDVKEFSFLRDTVSLLEHMCSTIINAKSPEQAEEISNNPDTEDVVEGEVNPDDIPF